MNWLAFFLLLAAALSVQLCLAARQSRSYLRQVMALRRAGRVAIGLGGRKFLGRKAYVAIAVSPEDRVTASLELRGWTQWAKGRPCPHLHGLALTDLAGEGALPGCGAIERAAVRQAAQTLRTAGGWQPSGGAGKGKGGF